MRPWKTKTLIALLVMSTAILLTTHQFSLGIAPEELNPQASFESELSKLAKYTSSSELCVAYYLNRQFHLDLKELRIPPLNIAELWLFGAVSPDKSRWMLWGNRISFATEH